MPPPECRSISAKCWLVAALDNVRRSVAEEATGEVTTALSGIPEGEFAACSPPLTALATNAVKSKEFSSDGCRSNNDSSVLLSISTCKNGFVSPLNGVSGDVSYIWTDSKNSPMSAGHVRAVRLGSVMLSSGRVRSDSGRVIGSILAVRKCRPKW